MKSKFILASLIALLFSGCGGQKDEKIGIMQMGSSTSMINAKATSCSGAQAGTTGDVSARYFRLSAPTLTWSDTETEAHITGIQFVLSGGPMGDLVQVLGGDEIKALFGLAPTSSSDAILARAASSSVPTTYTLQCPLTVGGFSIDGKVYNYAIDFNAVGTVVGFERNTTTGDEQDFSRDFFFTVHYSGKF